MLHTDTEPLWMSAVGAFAFGV